MALWKYFKLCTKDACDMPLLDPLGLLPDPLGPLSKELDSSIIKAANNEVTTAIGNSSGKCSAFKTR